MAFLAVEFSLLRRFYYKIENLLKSPIKMPPASEREMTAFPGESTHVSVEMCLNSRCSSDYDGNPKKYHWGVFDKSKTLSSDQIKKIISLANIPRFTDRRVFIQYERNHLYFVIENNTSDLVRDWVMIESGIQQQAICLVCAALGVGMVFRSLGSDGEIMSNSDYVTTRIKLDAMAPTYRGSFWSSSPPTDWKSRTKGNLLDPIRIGHNSLLSALESLPLEKNNGENLTDEMVSQLFWAARGKTPHYYKSRPWGMTIPTSHGEQNISSIYFLSDHRLLRYCNWRWNRPTHTLDLLSEISNDAFIEIMRLFPVYNCFISIGKNETSGRALWEVGYQVLNLMLQAHVLGVAYKAVLLDENQREGFRQAGIEDPIAALLLQKEEGMKITNSNNKSRHFT